MDQVALPENELAYLGMGTVVLIWAVTWPMGRVVAQELPPFSAAFIRFTFAFPVLFLILKIRQEPTKIDQKYRMKIIGLGLLQVPLYNFFYLFGLSMTSASDAVLIIATMPTLTAIMSALLYRDERLTVQRVLGLGIALAGISIVFLLSPNTDVQNRILGDLIIFLAAFTWATFTALSRPLYKEIKSLTFNAWTSFYGWLALGFLALLEQPWNIRPSKTAFAILFYLGVFAAALANTIYSFSIKRIGPSKTAIFVNLVPVLGILSSILWIGEKFSIWYLVSFVIIILGIRIVTKS